ncbi:MAG: dienelactone hydrolase family protein [Armatimonadetes bacterium]|nr:dienelactone hydrolase family protein [Armatimonadota bacterium]
MADYSILDMLQRRMRDCAARRQPWPAEPAAIRARQAATRAALLDCLGTRPDEVLDPQLRVEAEIPLDGTGVIQQRVVYRTEEDVWVPAHVYRPAAATGPLPGVLLIQGWDLDKWSLSPFKVQLAEAGYVVLFPDNRFSGERRHAATGAAEQNNLLPVSALFGLTFMGMNTWDNQRGLDVLGGLPGVDAERLGVVGLCWGGMQTWTLAALDERVKVCCPVCGTSTFGALVSEFVAWTGGHTCFGTYFNDWARHGDIQDIVACIAPRPLLVQNNVNDTWFPIAGLHQVVREVAPVYAALGADGLFEHAARNTVHDITGEFGGRVIEFLERHLR